MTTPHLDVRVARKATEVPDICSLELVCVDGRPLPAFSAGSHVDVHLPNGIVRQYSLFNDPDERHRYMIAVLKDPGSRGGSRAVHEMLNEGQSLRISPPRNLFPLAPSARRSLLLAGGIGITPILSMARRLSAQGADFELHYCTRSRARTAFRDSILDSAFSSRARFHHDDQGSLDLAALLAGPSVDRHLYACGPKGFMDAVIDNAKRSGWAEENVHYESFSPATISRDGDATFDVKLARSGRVISIPSDRSVTQALADAGIVIDTSCEQGVCGTCLTRVLEGQPDHRDMFLSPAEQDAGDCFLPCCSRSRSPTLVLDL